MPRIIGEASYTDTRTSTSPPSSRKTHAVKAIKGETASDNVPNVKGTAGAINLYRLYRKEYWNAVSTYDGNGDGVPDPSFTVAIANSWKNRKSY